MIFQHYLLNEELIQIFHKFLDYIRTCSFLWLSLDYYSQIMDAIWSKSSSITMNVLTLLYYVWSSISLVSNMVLYLMQRRNFTLAFQAAESVGIKSTLVSFNCILNELWPIYKDQIILFCTFERFWCFILKNSSRWAQLEVIAPVLYLTEKHKRYSLPRCLCLINPLSSTT